MYEARTNVFDYYKLFEKNVQLFYKGIFDKNILAAIGSYIKSIISNNPKISRKLFSIFIELAQNIAYYSAEKIEFDEKDVGIGSVLITEDGEQFTFASGNIVRSVDVETLMEKCDHINSLDRDSLRKYKREQRNLPQGPFDGAHIGLIQVALTASNPLDISVTPIDDQLSFFSIIVKIDK